MKKLFTLFLVFLTCAGTMFAVTINGLNYNLDEVNKTAEVSSYNSVSGSLIIPSSVTYNDVIYSVTSIGFVAFTDCTGLTSVEIPSSVTIIGNQAFQNCSNLIDLTIGNNVTSIGRYAFYNCSSLTSVEIPDGVSSIGEAAFLYCNLENFTLPNSVTSIGNNAFNGNNNLASPIYNSHIFARLPISYSGEYVIPDGIESIAGGSFVGSTNLTAITIPNSVTYIGLAAFYTCSGIETLTIGSGVSFIDDSAFEGCSGLTSIACKAVTPPACGFLTLDGIDYSIPLYVPEESIDLYKADYTWKEFANILPLAETSTTYVDQDHVQIGDLYYNLKNDGTAEVTYHVYQSSSNYSGITNIIIPESVEYESNIYNVTRIGDGAFDSSYYLVSIAIPNSIASIGKDAFYFCFRLINIEIPDGVFSIGNDAFSNCSALESIEIPNSVTNIGEEAFYGCSKLSNLIIGSSVISIGNYAFSECSSLQALTCESIIPPTCGGSRVFNGVDKSIPFYIPKNSSESYNTADVWKEFTNMIPIIDFPTSIPAEVSAHKNKAQKLLRQGNIYILTDDSCTYTLTGQQVK